MKRIICIITAFILAVSMAACVLAKSDGCYKGEKDANEWSSGAKFLYFGSTCLLGPVGLLINLLAMPAPPQDKLVGKSSAFVAEYVSCYKKTSMEPAVYATVYGCMGFFVLGSAAAFFIFAWPYISSFY